MISLITLLSITENVRHFNSEYGGYYLGHDDTKVAFGYTVPLKTDSFNNSPLLYTSILFANEFYYKDVIEYMDCYSYDNTLFNFPSLDDGEFIATKMAKHNIRLSAWIIHSSNRGSLAIYNFKKRNVLAMSPNHEMTKAPILLIRYVDILK